MKTLKTVLFTCLFSLTSTGFAKVKSGLVHTPVGPRNAFYEEQNGYHIAEWDIQVEPYKKEHAYDKANSRYFGKWKNKTVPYLVDKTLPEPERIQAAIDYFHTNTSIRLVERTTEKDYVYFRNNGNSGCNSWVGRKGGKQVINVPKWCAKGNLIHEILHALGFNHEQSRPDRNKFIRIHWTNIQLKRIFNFFRSPFAKKYGTFDFDSIMLYSSFNSFAKNPKKPTMTRRDTGEAFKGQRDEMSEMDLKALDEHYHN